MHSFKYFIMLLLLLSRFNPVRSLIEIPWRRERIPTPVFWPENPTDRGAWRAPVHGVTKSLTRPSDFIFTFHFHALEKEMATHSSVLAWRIPGTEEPGGLPFMESQSRTGLKRLSSSSSIIKYLNECTEGM